MAVMQHCFGSQGGGGPVGALDRLQQYADAPYPEIRQLAPAGGLNVALLREFVKKIRGCNPSILHVRGLGNEGFHGALAGRLAGVPNILVSIHGTQRDLRSPANAFKRWIVVNALERITLSLATHIATVHNGALDRDFLKPYREKLVGAVPNGVIIQSSTDDETRRAVRERLSIAPDTAVGICVSRLVADKGYLVLADALERMRPQLAGCQFIIVGGGDETGNIRERFLRIPGIVTHFTGQQLDVLPYLRASDFFVQASLHENLSNALLEAMAAGLPVVATSVGGTPEVLAKGGGMLVPADDADALGGAIVRMHESSAWRAEHAAAASKNIAANYSVQRMVDGWRAIYERILGVTP